MPWPAGTHPVIVTTVYDNTLYTTQEAIDSARARGKLILLYNRQGTRLCDVDYSPSKGFWSTALNPKNIKSIRPIKSPRFKEAK